MNGSALANDQDDKAAVDFAEGAYGRIGRTMLVLALLAIPGVWIKLGQSAALAFIGGCAIAFLNLYWLKGTIQRLLDATVSSAENAEKSTNNKKPSSGGVVLRFVLRYALIALALYAIFKGSAMSVYGLVGGLSLPVGAVMMEAVYQTFRAWKH